jgi:hypothetical protein
MEISPISPNNYVPLKQICRAAADEAKKMGRSGFLYKLLYLCVPLFSGASRIEISECSLFIYSVGTRER